MTPNMYHKMVFSITYLHILYGRIVYAQHTHHLLHLETNIYAARTWVTRDPTDDNAQHHDLDLCSSVFAARAVPAMGAYLD